MNSLVPAFFQQKNKKILFILWGGDLLFILLYLLLLSGVISGSRYNITKDYGLGEVFQYFKELALSVVLLKIYWDRTDKLFLVWSALFIYLLLDDFLQLHEQVGDLFAALLDGQLPQRVATHSESIGEFIFLSLVGTSFMVLLLKSYFSSNNKLMKAASQDILLLFGLLVFFGVVVDLIHSLWPATFLKIALGVLEDGGEMLVMSALLWHVYQLKALPSQPKKNYP